MFDWIATSTPEAEGIPSSAINAYLDAIHEENLQLHSLYIIRNDKMIASGVAAPFTPDSIHRIYSAAKGIVSAATLFAISEGYFTFDTPVAPLLRAHMPANADPRWEKLTIYHLLTMTTGHNKETFSAMRTSDDWVRTFFETPPVNEPGSTFFYDIGAQYVLNFLILQETGMNVDEYLKPRLLEPLGIEMQAMHGAQEIFNSSSIHLRPVDMAKLAYFYLHEGSWNGRQLLDPELARDAGRFHVSNYDPRRGLTNATAGYALHMWRNAVGGFRLDGGQGQYGVVLPDANMAVGIMSSDQKAFRILELFFDKIYSVCRRRPLAENPAEYQKMTEKLAKWNLVPDSFSFYSPKEQALNGKTVTFAPNALEIQSVGFTFGDKTALTVRYTDGAERTAAFGRCGQWLDGRGYLFTRDEYVDVGDLGLIMFRDPAASLCTAGWLDNDRLKFVFRSASLLSELYGCFRFSDSGVELSVSPAFLPDNGVPQMPPMGARPIILRGSFAD